MKSLLSSVDELLTGVAPLREAAFYIKSYVAGAPDSAPRLAIENVYKEDQRHAGKT
jgi:hypothetical protein